MRAPYTRHFKTSPDVERAVAAERTRQRKALGQEVTFSQALRALIARGAASVERAPATNAARIGKVIGG